MIKIGNKIIPQDFVNRHGDVMVDQGYATCKCGTDIDDIGQPNDIMRGDAFKNHIKDRFKIYKSRQRKLLGGDISG